jgi:hypothetical protein
LEIEVGATYLESLKFELKHAKNNSGLSEKSTKSRVLCCSDDLRGSASILEGNARVKGKMSIVKVITRKSSYSSLSEPGGVVVKHRGLWSPRREFESLPGYYRPGVNSYFFQFEFRGFL